MNLAPIKKKTDNSGDKMLRHDGFSVGSGDKRSRLTISEPPWQNRMKVVATLAELLS